MYENQLGWAYLEADRPPRAREFFFRSRLHDAAGVLIGSNERGIGEAFLREGNAPSAEPSLARAVLKSASPAERDEARLLRAIGLERLGRAEEARAVRREIENPDRASLVLLERSLALPPSAAAPRAASASKEEEAPASPLEIQPRLAWNPRPMGRDVEPMETPTRITVHHSATPFAGTSKGETAQEIRNIQRIHQEVSGWADIGYHYVVDRAGRIWEARPLRVQGAHAGNREANRGNIGICLLGNFEAEPVPRKQAEGLRAILRDCMARFRVPANRVYTHSEIRARHGLRPTDCPGRSLQAFVERLRSARASGQVLARVD
jgi:hypothetical protein